MKKYSKVIIFIILVVIWYITVFSFSAKNAYESSKYSKDLTYEIFNLGPKDKKEEIIEESLEREMSKNSNKDTLDYFNVFMRKLAHFSEYGLGCVLIFLAVIEINKLNANNEDNKEKKEKNIDKENNKIKEIKILKEKLKKVKEKLKIDKINKEKKLAIISIIIVCAFAISDEIHQLFVPGRSCQALDVLIDTTGGAFGIFVFLNLKKVFIYLKKKDKEKNK